MADYLKPVRGKVDLGALDPSATPNFSGDKEDSRKELAKLNVRLEALQELLYAERKRKLLIVLQGMDTSGKDGTIRHVFEGIDPVGVRVVSFKAPTPEELDHDFLWRIHRQVPGRGEVVIFNRSHYEDVLIARVRNLVPKEVWSARYEQINQFEELLVSTGTVILKFYLRISLDEQKERLQARVADPTKRWKFHAGDLEERKLWSSYEEAYGQMLEKTSSELAPWYVVPSDRKWYRSLVIAQTIVTTLEALDMKYPLGEPGLDAIVIE